MESRDDKNHDEHKETDSPPESSSETGNGGTGKEKGDEDHGERAKKAQHKPREDHKPQQNSPGDRHEEKGGHSAKSPSLARILLYSGVAALVCGVAGAWGYSAMFGSSKPDDHKSSSKKSDSGKGADSGKESDSDEGTDSRKKADTGKILQAEAAWTDAVKELREARSAEKSARRSEEDYRSMLDFFKRNLLASGRAADTSLTESFWAGGPGKDPTLRKAVDLAESRVDDAFAERPLVEASVREMLGLAYLNLGAAPQAVEEYERSLMLREAMRGSSEPETASCRNQLAVAYRLAGRASDAARLFGRNTSSPARAAALAVRGSTLLLQKQPKEAELKLRECLTICQKIEPDAWTTFDTQSLLGEALADQREYDEAESLLLAGYEGLKHHEDTIPEGDKPRITKALERLVKLYEAWGKKDKEAKWQKELETAEALAEP
jgi:tetratricopeptide (TPR) repeat protein